ncbi:phage tail protein I [Chromobacterium phragmitis]|uniref:Phage tail protein I n=1 Tax=Chromobacterium phragmitis TaxID=2202141 RepID=A0A344UIJ2_9NEIS|nr:phage tail protein I [Chromobacterium phragmitis]AXE35090.1 phage tail protein I [Chromobacterium phragmitis]
MTDITPNVLAGDTRLSLPAELSRRLPRIDLAPFLVYLVDQVEADFLPLLAEQLHVAGDEGWQLAAGEAQRRDLIKQAIALHRYKGTRWALRQVLATLDLDGRVSEWFEYQGRPFHFKVDLDLSGRGLGEAAYQALRQMLDQYRNARSRLESLDLRVELHERLPAVAAVSAGGEVASVYPRALRGLARQGPLRLAAAHGVAETASILPWRRERLDGQAPLRWGMALPCREAVTLYPRSFDFFPKSL